MANNSQSLTDAKVNKKDEFYTTYEDIEKEMVYYKDYLKDKTILMPCDSTNSNFFTYFYNNFKKYQLKKIISIFYNFDNPSIQTEYDGNEIQTHNLKGNGDFRNIETIELMKTVDVVITNPPFSLFRQFIEILDKTKVKYLILGDINTITTKSVWGLIMQNKLWLGKTIHSGDRKFYVPDNYPLQANTCGIDENGKRFIKVKGIRWFTNIKYIDMYQDLTLTQSYTDEKYPFFDNNKEVISISKTKDIPYDYKGLMGVPITFFDKYNPKQFEIIGMDKDLYKTRFILNNKKLYARIVIKKREV